MFSRLAAAALLEAWAVCARGRAPRAVSRKLRYLALWCAHDADCFLEAAAREARSECERQRANACAGDLARAHDTTHANAFARSATPQIYAPKLAPSSPAVCLVVNSRENEDEKNATVTAFDEPD